MQEIYAKEETFGISSPSTLEEDHEARQESRHAMNVTPNDPRTEASTCKSSGTQPENNEAWIARIQALTVKETTSKPTCKCTQIRNHARSNRGETGAEPGQNGPGPTGLGRPAQPTPGPVRRPLCPRCSSIYCLCLRRLPHPSNHSTDAYSPEIHHRKMRERVG
jgi:hypothetical protein